MPRHLLLVLVKRRRYWRRMKPLVRARISVPVLRTFQIRGRTRHKRVPAVEDVVEDATSS